MSTETDKKWFDVPLVQMVVAGTLGAAGMAGVDISKSGDYLDKKIYYAVSQECTARVNQEVEHMVVGRVESLKNAVDRKLDKVYRDIPPKGLRRRVVAIENHLQSKQDGFKVPTYDWY